MPVHNLTSMPSAIWLHLHWANSPGVKNIESILGVSYITEIESAREFGRDKIKYIKRRPRDENARKVGRGAAYAGCYSRCR